MNSKKIHNIDLGLEQNHLRAIRISRTYVRLSLKQRFNPIQYLKGINKVELQENRLRNNRSPKVPYFFLKSNRLHKSIQSMSVNTAPSILKNLSLGSFLSLKAFHIKQFITNVWPDLYFFIKKTTLSSRKLETITGLYLHKRLIQCLNLHKKIRNIDGIVSAGQHDRVNVNLDKYFNDKNIFLSLNYLQNFNFNFPEALAEKLKWLEYKGLASNFNLDAAKAVYLKFLALNCTDNEEFLDPKIFQNMNNFKVLSSLNISLVLNNDDSKLFSQIIETSNFPETLTSLKFSLRGNFRSISKEKIESKIQGLSSLCNLKKFEIDNTFETNNQHFDKDRISFEFMKLLLKVLPKQLESLILVDGNLRILGTPLKIDKDEEFFEYLYLFDKLKVLALNFCCFPLTHEGQKTLSYETLRIQNADFSSLMFSGNKFDKLKTFLYHGNILEKLEVFKRMIEWVVSQPTLEYITTLTWAEDADMEIIQDLIILPSKLINLKRISSLFVRMIPDREKLKEMILKFAPNPSLHIFNLTFSGTVIMKKKNRLVITNEV